MADLTVGTSVVQTSGPTPVIGIAGEALTVNQAVYLDQAVSPPTWKKAKADASATAAAQGIALNTAASGGQVLVAITGALLTLSGATFTKGTAVYVSAAAAGALTLVAALSSGNYPVMLGYSPSSTTLVIHPVNFGVTL